MFYIGDLIFYPVFGAGCILNIEEKEVCGEIRKYYIIKFLSGDMNIMVPVGSQEEKKMRKAISEEEYPVFIKILTGEPKALSSKWSERYKYYNQSIKIGNIFKLAEILRDIAGLSKCKELSKSEVKIFNQILKLVSGEISLVKKIDCKYMEGKILELLDTGLGLR